MTAPKFTPAKWLAEQDGDENWNVVVADHNSQESLFLRYVVGNEGLYRCDGSDEANAHLIAAAPELYEALGDYMSAFGQALDAYGIPYTEQQRDAFNLAVAALAKARGEG